MEKPTQSAARNESAVVKFDEKKLCGKRVYDRGYWDNKGHLCGKSAKVLHDGKWFCGMHDPVKRTEKQKARDEARRAEWDAKVKRKTLEWAASDMLEALQKALEHCEREGGPDVELIRDDNSGHMLDVKMIRAAISKATGVAP